MNPDAVLQRLEELQKVLQEVELKRIRLEGAMDEVKKEMKKLGFPTIKKLENEKTRLINEKTEKTDALEKLLTEFEDQYLDLLDELT